MAAILDLKVKFRSTYQNNVRNEFCEPKNPKKHIPHTTAGKTTEKLTFNIGGSHLGLEGQI